MATLLTNIRTLAGTHSPAAPLRGKDLASLPTIDDAFLIIESDRIASFGPMTELAHQPADFARHVNLTGRTVLPAWCDSHTHIVFAGCRESEFVDKIRGLSYADIAAKGGGILASARKLNDTPEEELYQTAFARLQELITLGTGAIEIKSGYGLTVEGELKMLRVIRRLKEKAGIPVKATFLGAHAIPAEFTQDRDGYLGLVTDTMLPQIAAAGLADFVDVFCETGFFTPAETERICAAAKAYGLQPKIHANQLHVSGGVQAGVRAGAISVDHLESMDDEATRILAGSNTIGTLLPTAAFFLRMPYQPARSLIDAGCAIALASDFNPGSSPSGNMNFVVSLACIQMRMLPEEAINAATINGAFAMGVQDEVGSIATGKKANLIITKKIPSLAYLPYSFGSRTIEAVVVDGRFLIEDAASH
jgi:imidazolonepropionase